MDAIMDLIDDLGGWLAVALATVLVGAVCLFNGTITTSTPASVYHGVVSGVGSVAEAVITIKVATTLDYECGDYGHSKTLQESIDDGDPFGVQNANTRLAKRVAAEVKRLEKQGCTVITVR